MNSGYHPTRKDRRDYDILKMRAHKLAGVATLPESYSVNAGFRVPNQEREDDNFTPPVPPLPFGCTDYAQAEILGNEDGKLYNPMEIENVTHANAKVGADLRDVLKAVVKLYPSHPYFFNIRPAGAIDAFDAVRLTMLSTSSERRGVSVGSPFWFEWGANVGTDGILPPPAYAIKSMHNWVVEGWTTINGTCYLVCQMLQGDGFGDKGLVYMPREQFNATMAVPGSIMFTIDKLFPGEVVQPVGSPFVQVIVDFIRSIFHV